MTRHNLEDLKSTHPAAHARALELSEQIYNKAIRSSMLGESRIDKGLEHRIKEFDIVSDPESRKTFICVESTIMSGPFYAGNTKIVLFDDESEFERARAEWQARHDSTVAR